MIRMVLVVAIDCNALLYFIIEMYVPFGGGSVGTRCGG